jgi:acetyl-CoA carboxylase biotin carboxyl carrier protein
MAEKFTVDNESVRGLAKLLEETGLTEIEYQVGEQRIRIVRSNPTPTIVAPAAPVPSVAPALNSVETPAAEPTGEIVSSPMVGTVYLSAEPGGAPFVTPGSVVKKGDTLVIVEAMKVMNPIRSPRDGKVLQVCAADTKPVEFGAPLVILE